MNQTVKAFGFCPVQQKDYCIWVSYLQAEQNLYIKGVSTCEYAKGKNLSCVDSCPIAKDAPNLKNL